MKNLIIIFLVFLRTYPASSICNCNYSYSGATDTLYFTNLSAVSNAHYYWSFGDGSGSNDLNPVHVFPDDGDYLVILYGHDTITDCSNYFQSWIHVTKPDTLTCQIAMDANIVNHGNYDNLEVTNLSQNCNGYSFICQVAGPGQNYCNPGVDSGWGSTIFVAGIRAYIIDSIYDDRIFKECYKTVPYLFDPSINYQRCSPNFEINIDYMPNGALVNLQAMNLSGVDTFWITGFGNGIPISGPSASYLYPYINNTPTFPWIIDHVKTDSSCSVHGTRQIIIKNPYYHFPVNCEILNQPFSISAIIGTTAYFYISTSDTAVKQWQQDAGIGYVNLTNAGLYSGVNTDTLTIDNIQLTMNNYHYRCVLGNDQYGCHNTSNEVSLTVSVGIDEINELKALFYPNPVTDNLNVELGEQYIDCTNKIYNVFGQMLTEKKMTGNKEIVDFSEYANGLYILEVYSMGKTTRKLIIKQ